MDVWRLRPKDANVEFMAAALKSKEDYRKLQALQMVTAKNLRIVETLFVDYGMKDSLE